MSHIISFYSYKGGTGRSVLLANVATLLAIDGYKVACIDLDINAPGLDVIFDLNEDNIPEMTICDYFRGMPVSVTDLCVKYHELKPMDGELYVFPIPRPPSGQRIEPVIDGMMDGGLKRLIEKIDSDLGVDFILLDARSGFCRESVIHFQIADKIFVVTRYSYQHLAGTIHIINLLNRIKDIRKLIKPLEYFLVINGIPKDLPTNIREDLNSFALNYNAILIEEDSELKWKDKIIVFNKYHPLINRFREVEKAIVE